MPKLKTTLWIFVGVVMIASVILALRQWRIAQVTIVELQRTAAVNRDLKTRLDATTRERDALRAAHLGIAPPEPRPTQGSPDQAELAKAAIDAQTIQQLRDNLTAANAHATRLEEQVAQLETDLKSVSDENQRRTKSQQDLGDKVDEMTRIINAMDREAKSRNDRLVQLEMTNRRLRDENQAATQKTSQATHMDSDLQELYRRREVYLTSLLSRYREVTDQFRAFSGMLENRGRQESGTGGGPELSRIQNSISLAEEDMRQLSSLNAQAQQLQRKLFGK